MAYCSNCGADVQGRFCAKCGAPVSDSSAEGTPPTPPNEGYASNPPGAAPYSAPSSGGLTNNVAAALAYLGFFITGIVFLAIAPYNRNRFVRFHAWQSIFLTVAWFVVWIVIAVISGVLGSMSFALLSLVSLLSFVIWLAFLAAWIFLMVKAYNHQEFRLPIIGDLAAKQA
jgi:uncharacterized membrane protein